MSNSQKSVILAANWKMNMSVKEIENFFGTLQLHNIKEKTSKNVNIIIFASYLHLQNAMELAKNFNINIGAQNCCFDEIGAYTGEISEKMLAEINVSHVILGHSERKQNFSETNEMINKKLRSAIKFNIVPILCVGETQNERKFGCVWEAVSVQLKSIFDGIDEKFFEKIIIAYEPSWAIGGKISAAPAQINDMCRFIREIMRIHFKFTEEIRVLYGGSVTSENSADILSQPEINGVLIGKASLDPVEFAKIIEIA
jgi:triosephosphate isomerase